MDDSIDDFPQTNFMVLPCFIGRGDSSIFPRLSMFTIGINPKNVRTLTKRFFEGSENVGLQNRRHSCKLTIFHV